MKPASPELLALLATRQWFQADCITIALQNSSTVLRYTTGDMDITANGVLYSSGAQIGPYWDRKDNKAKLHQKIGTGVDQLIIDCLPGTAQVLGVGLVQAAHMGWFDAAIWYLDRAYMPTYGDTTRGLVRMFVGRVAEIDAGRSIATFTINSHLELFNQQFPRNLYEPQCINSLGDGSCLATVPSTTGVIASGTTSAVIHGTLAGEPFAAGAFDAGAFTLTSGTLDGLTIGVKTATPVNSNPAIITLQGPLPIAPAIGDTFLLQYGCNKSSTDANGCTKFSNLNHFRGFPYVPQPVISA